MLLDKVPLCHRLFLLAILSLRRTFRFRLRDVPDMRDKAVGAQQGSCDSRGVTWRLTLVHVLW